MYALNSLDFGNLLLKNQQSKANCLVLLIMVFFMACNYLFWLYIFLILFFHSLASHFVLLTSDLVLQNYSYRNASIGSNFDALIAGYNPETNATIKLVITAANIAFHGKTKAKSVAVEKM
jgi:hypothetical protein